MEVNQMFESIIIATMLASMQPKTVAWSGTQTSPLSNPHNAKIESLIEVNNDFYDVGFWCYRSFDQHDNLIDFQIDCK